MSRSSPIAEPVNTAKKESIFQATCQLLAKQDFHSLTIEDIAKKAGIAKGTVYLYFKNKESLYTDLVQSLFHELSSRIDAVIKTESDPKQRLYKVLHTQLGFFQEHMDIFVHFFRDRKETRSATCLKDAFKDFISKLATIFRSGIDQGKFRPIDPIKGSVILMGLVRSSIIQRIHGFSTSPLTADVDEVWDIFMNGIGK